MGLGIEFGEWLAAKLRGQGRSGMQAYDHAEIYVGQADEAGPYGYTFSAYPDNPTYSTGGKRRLPCPPEQLPGSIWSSGLIQMTPVQRSGIVGWCEAHPRVRYSWLDYEAIALHALHVPAPGLKDFIGSTARMICSYYTDKGLSSNGVHLFQDQRWEGYVTPLDLAELLEAKAHLAALTEDPPG